MKVNKKIILPALIAMAAIVVSVTFVVSGKADPGTPGSWHAAGSHPKEYKMETTDKVKHTGAHSAMIKFTSDEKPSGFGTYMQMHKPGMWAAKKVKMTGYIKSENVTEWAGMWCRVDAANSQESLDFDNMQDRPIKGTTDWTKYEITVNIPSDAGAVAYGVLLGGKGTVYFDDITFEVLGPAESKPHNKAGAAELPAKPGNLNFED